MQDYVAVSKESYEESVSASSGRRIGRCVSKLRCLIFGQTEVLMATGYKTGGRQKGTPNKRNAAVADLLSTLGCDPIEGMARIAMDTTNAVELRGRMYAELAGYLFAKRKATEIKLDDGPRVTFQFLTESLTADCVDGGSAQDQAASI